jgi:hypothetical protein
MEVTLYIFTRPKKMFLKGIEIVEQRRRKNQFLALLVATAKMFVVKVGILIDTACLPCQPTFLGSLHVSLMISTF